MQIEYKQWAAFCLANVFLYGSCSVSAGTTSKVVRLYGAEQGVRTQASPSAEKHYKLQLAAFKNKQNAVDFKNKMTRYTNESVQLTYNPKARVPYHVFVGPIADIETLQRVSRQLLSEAGQHTPRRTIDETHQATNQAALLNRSKSAPSNRQQSFLTTHDLSKVVTVSVGPAWSNPQKTQALTLQPDIKKTYVSTNGSSSLLSGEIFLGLQRPLYSMLDGQLGVAVAGASNVNLSGDVWEDMNPNFNNYVYKYNVNHAHVALKAKLLSHVKDIYSPYVSGSLGAGFNHAYAFSLTPKIYEEVPAPLFRANTTTALTYTLGLGIQRAMNANWQVGVGYEFADWGKSHLAAAPEQTIGNGLSLNHLYTNELQLSITYLPKD